MKPFSIFCQTDLAHIPKSASYWADALHLYFRQGDWSDVLQLKQALMNEWDYTTSEFMINMKAELKSREDFLNLVSQQFFSASLERLKHDVKLLYLINRENLITLLDQKRQDKLDKIYFELTQLHVAYLSLNTEMTRNSVKKPLLLLCSPDKKISFDLKVAQAELDEFGRDVEFFNAIKWIDQALGSSAYFRSLTDAEEALKQEEVKFARLIKAPEIKSLHNILQKCIDSSTQPFERACYQAILAWLQSFKSHEAMMQDFEKNFLSFIMQSLPKGINRYGLSLFKGPLMFVLTLSAAVHDNYQLRLDQHPNLAKFAQYTKLAGESFVYALGTTIFTLGEFQSNIVISIKDYLSWMFRYLAGKPASQLDFSTQESQQSIYTSNIIMPFTSYIEAQRKQYFHQFRDGGNKSNLFENLIDAIKNIFSLSIPLEDKIGKIHILLLSYLSNTTLTASGEKAKLALDQSLRAISEIESVLGNTAALQFYRTYYQTIYALEKYKAEQSRQWFADQRAGAKKRLAIDLMLKQCREFYLDSTVSYQDKYKRLQIELNNLKVNSDIVGNGRDALASLQQAIKAFDQETGLMLRKKNS